MKRNKYIIIFIALIGLVFTSCKDDNQLFDESARERTNKAINELHEVLMSAGTDGWKVQYYTDTAYYGAYNILMSFAENQVTMQGDELFPTGKYTSDYAVSSPQGVALVFTSYSDVLTYLADPDKTNVTSSGETLGGDSEFIWLKTAATHDTIYFKTKKSEQAVQFIKYSGNWDEYFAKLKRMSDLFVSGDMDRYFKQIETGGVSLLLSGYDAVKRTMNPIYITANDSLIVQTNGISFTDTGFEFFEPLLIGGKNVQHFTYNEANGAFEINDPGVTGNAVSVDKPSQEFPGNINSKVFVDKHTYLFSAMSPQLMDIYAEVIDTMVERFGNDLQGLTFRIHPEKALAATAEYWFEIILSRRSEEYADLLMIHPIGIDKSKRSDNILFKFREGMQFDETFNWQSITLSDDLKPVVEAIRPLVEEFLKIILGPVNGKSFYIIPSPDYKTFTFGASLSSNYFTLRYNGFVE